MPKSTPQGKIYLGYGSNLWLHQMLELRCPKSTYLGIGRLNGYRWVINQRGYANVIPSEKAEELHWNSKRYLETVSSDVPQQDVVYGLVYALTPADEWKLDINEGAPRVYQKHMLSVDFWRAKSIGEQIDLSRAPEKKEMLVYVDVNNVTDDKPREEYVCRMNNGIRDALARGVPKAYVDGVVRLFIPDSLAKPDEKTEKLALEQARDFNDSKDPSATMLLYEEARASREVA